MHNIAYGHEHMYGQCGIQTGQELMTPTANAVTSVQVTFPQPFAAPPDIVLVSPLTPVPYSNVRYASASDYTAEGFTLHLYRTTAAQTAVAWMAVGRFL